MSLPAPSRTDDFSVFITLFHFRFVNVAALKTFFQPDEYYQALEPAWNFTPGHHGAWMTWEWAQHLRSALHPALFSLLYCTVDIAVRPFVKQEIVDNALLLAPKLGQTVIAAVGDFYTWKLSQKVYRQQRLAFVTLCLTVLNPWQWFCSTRTFSNGLENSLTVAALYYWPYEWQPTTTSLAQQHHEKPSKAHVAGGQKYRPAVIADLRVALVLAALATVLRPTNLLIWIVLACMSVLSADQKSVANGGASKMKTTPNGSRYQSVVLHLVREGLLCGTAVLALSALVDRAFYGSWTFPALNFLYFNVVQSLAVFYGNNDWHYYISQGYPLLLTTTLPFAIIGLTKVLSNAPSFQLLNASARRSLKQLAITSIVLPAALSVLSHKEVRFIYPVLGPLLVIATNPVLEFFQPVFIKEPQAAGINLPTKILRGSLLFAVVSINILIAYYTSQIHNSGLIALPNYFRDEFKTHYSTSQLQPQNMTISILMPCHSLPWRSHLLNGPTSSTPGIQAWALTCEPPLHLTDPISKSTYLDEADIFYKNPSLWIRKNMSRQPPQTFKTPNPSTHNPGIHIGHQQPHRNKSLWTSRSINHPLNDRPSLDITDLLPLLRTSPNHAPAMIELDHPIRRPWPHYLAFFAQLEPAMTTALRGSGYTECWRVFNSHWHDDWRRQGDVVVWCLFPERARDVSRRESGVDLNYDDNFDANEDVTVATQMQNQETSDVVSQTPGKQTVIRDGVL